MRPLGRPYTGGLRAHHPIPLLIRARVHRRSGRPSATGPRFGGCHAPIPALPEATRPEAVLQHDVNELATPLPSDTVGRVALLGDAAHAMTPNLGQGACPALEDAATLAAALAAETTIDSASSRYDAERRPRSRAVARAARQAGRTGRQLQHQFTVAVRNTALRLARPPPRSARSCGTPRGRLHASADCFRSCSWDVESDSLARTPNCRRFRA